MRRRCSLNRLLSRIMFQNNRNEVVKSKRRSDTRKILEAAKHIYNYIAKRQKAIGIITINIGGRNAKFSKILFQKSESKCDHT